MNIFLELILDMDNITSITGRSSTSGCAHCKQALIWRTFELLLNRLKFQFISAWSSAGSHLCHSYPEINTSHVFPCPLCSRLLHLILLIVTSHLGSFSHIFTSPSPIGLYKLFSRAYVLLKLSIGLIC